MQQTHLTHEQLTAYRDGRLAEAHESDVESHLADCPQCCERLDALPDSIVDLFHKPTAASAADDGYIVLSHDADDAYEDDWSVEASRGLVMESRVETKTNGDSTAVERPVSPDMRTALANHPRYRILELLGSGGMGDVYKSEHRLMQRTVALKVIRRDLVRQPQAVERFRREVQAAAKLDHPNIVTAHDAEQVADWHFLVMEYVDGATLADEVANRGPLPIREACEFTRQAAVGLQHAYEQGMVHRDIKPHNLMLDAVRASSLPAARERLEPPPTVKILDFGLASLATETEEAQRETTSKESDSQLTRAGSMMGTPDYVAPEQARDASAADIRADIYSLGCTLYFLLTGQPPSRSVIQSFHEADAATAENARLRFGLPEKCPDELVTILGRMLAERPEDRFQAPADVVEALSQLTTDTPPEPQPSPAHTETPKPASKPASPRPEPDVDWSGRSAIGCVAIAGLACAGAVFLLGYVIVVTTDYGKIIVESEVDDIRVVFRQGNEEVEVIDLRTESQVRLASGDYQIELKGDANHVALDRDQLTLRRLGKEIVRIRRVPQTPAASRPNSSKPRSTGDPLIISEPLHRLAGHTAIVRGLDISPDGKHLISASWDGSGRLWDLQSGEMIHLFHHEPRVNDARYSRGGRKIIFAENATVRVYDAETYQRLPIKFEHPKPLTKLEFSDDHRQMLTGCLDGQMRLWDTQTGKLLKTYGGHKKSLEAVVFTADATEVLSGSLDTTVRRFHTESGRLNAWYPHPGMVLSMCSSPEGRVVYVGCSGGVIMAWDFENGQIIKQFRGHEGEVLRLATHGRMLVSVGSDRTARVWDVATGRELIRMVGHQDRIDALAISPDGRLIATGGGFHPVSKATWEKPDYVIRVWEIEPLTLNGLPAKASDRSENLVNDPSLENSPIGKAFPPGWGDFNAEPKDGYHFELVEGGRTGKHGWLIEGDGTYITVPTNRVPIVRDKRYVGRSWVKLSGGGSAQVRLLYFDTNRTYIGETRLARVSASDQWQQVSITDRIADFPATHFVALAMSVIGHGKAVFDDLELRAVASESIEQP